MIIRKVKILQASSYCSQPKCSEIIATESIISSIEGNELDRNEWKVPIELVVGNDQIPQVREGGEIMRSKGAIEFVIIDNEIRELRATKRIEERIERSRKLIVVQHERSEVAVRAWDRSVELIVAEIEYSEEG